MSAEEHRAGAGAGPVLASVVVVSSTRTADDDTSGRAIADSLRAAGHTVRDRLVVTDDESEIRRLVAALVQTGTELIVLTGGTGPTPSDVTPEALEPLWDRRLEGFGELFRFLSFQQVGAAAMLSRAVGGLIGGAAVFALPGSTRACRLAMEELVLPEARHLVHLARRVQAPRMPSDTLDEPDPITVEAEIEDGPVAAPAVDEDTVEAEFEEAEDEPALPPPTGTLGKLGGGRATLELTPEADAPIPTPEGDMPSTGWRRALYEIGGEIRREIREELPQPIEKLSPVVNVLEQAGEVAVLVLPSGTRYSLWGFPDLHRDGSKVLAVGWGAPLAEVLALHRYPIQTGTCVDEGHGLLPGRSTHGVADTAEAVTGRAPPNAEGVLYAVGSDAVYIERQGRVWRWDGSHERDMGNGKQALATLVLEWSQR